MSILSKMKKAVKLAGKINIISGLVLNAFHKFNGYFVPYKNSYLDIHKNAKIIINNGSIFAFNHKMKKDPRAGMLKIEKNGQLIVNGNFNVYAGSRIIICENAVLELNGGYINSNLMMVCRTHIKIGCGATISSNVVIRDNDAHKIINGNHQPKQPVEIGNHVWIGTNVTILKGVKIGDGAIIGANSLVNRNIPPKTLAVGVPAKVIKENVEWR